MTGAPKTSRAPPSRRHAVEEIATIAVRWIATSIACPAYRARRAIPPFGRHARPRIFLSRGPDHCGAGARAPHLNCANSAPWIAQIGSSLRVGLGLNGRWRAMLRAEPKAASHACAGIRASLHAEAGARLRRGPDMDLGREQGPGYARPSQPLGQGCPSRVTSCTIRPRSWARVQARAKGSTLSAVAQASVRRPSAGDKAPEDASAMASEPVLNRAREDSLGPLRRKGQLHVPNGPLRLPREGSYPRASIETLERAGKDPIRHRNARCRGRLRHGATTSSVAV